MLGDEIPTMCPKQCTRDARQLRLGTVMLQSVNDSTIQSEQGQTLTELACQAGPQWNRQQVSGCISSSVR